jgi:predicted component of type VI protein secretion system
MALRLEVQSDHRKALGDAASIVFGVGGGSFGRASDNDWVLPDPQRYLSGHHARVHFRQGAFYLEDLSTNGVYVNGATLPVSRTGPHAIRDGDVLRFGEYEVRATVDALETTGNTSSLLKRTGMSSSVERITPVRVGAGSDDLGASLNFDALIHADGGANSGEFTPLPIGARSDGTALRLQRLRAAARARLEGHAPAALQDLRSSLQAFCRGAGIDATKLPPDAELRLLHAAGQLFREVLLGLQDLSRERAEFQNRYGVDAPESGDAAGSPALSRLGADDYLLRLLEGHDRRELDALVLMREELKAAVAHDAALAQALPQAFSAFIGHLAPEEIQSRFDAAGARSARTSPWDLYTEIFRNLTQLNAGPLPHLFAEALAQAYLAAVKNPATGEN